ncbi:hypothetical protein BDZ89DRAFT_212886 [Hymenopellis radicata]|nr:hypothetical protein BDZ89DRAFT_212886 [Hymenopellis radicata]
MSLSISPGLAQLSAVLSYQTLVTRSEDSSTQVFRNIIKGSVRPKDSVTYLSPFVSTIFFTMSLSVFLLVLTIDFLLRYMISTHYVAITERRSPATNVRVDHLPNLRSSRLPLYIPFAGLYKYFVDIQQLSAERIGFLRKKSSPWTLGDMAWS